MSHLFGDLLHQHLHRKHGLTQARLAEGILQDPAVISNMCRGRRLTGKQARERVVTIIRWLHAQEALSTQEEADALLNAAGLIGLRANVPEEIALTADLLPVDSVIVDPPDLLELPAESDHGPPSNLPQPTTPFVGRQHELEQLMVQLTNLDCRLLSLAGPGGFGKTRLAIRLGELFLECPEGRSNGVYFVALDGLDNAARVVPTIAATLGFSFHEQENQENQLLHFLKNKQLLLILDNAEGILAPELAARMVGSATKLKLLITTREALNLKEEWFHPIAGMNVGDGEHEPTMETVDAIRLFEQCALRARPNFDLDSEVASVQTICKLVDGVPLAIELAAAWVRLLPCQQIALELMDSIDLLTSTLHNVPERHRSLRVVLEQSWRYLNDEERQVFRKLSIFVGGFGLQAAQDVTQASLSVLARLVDTSMVQVGRQGRYRIHALLHLMGTERLADNPEELAAIEAAHSAYYLGVLRDHQQSIYGPDQRRIITVVEAELDNIRRAWHFAARHHALDQLREAQICLFHVLWARGRYSEGAEFLEQAYEALDGDEPNARNRRMRVMICARLALFIAAEGDMEDAAAMLQTVQAQIDSTETSSECAYAHYVAGLLWTYKYKLIATFEYEAPAIKALTHLTTAYNIYRTLGDDRSTAEVALRMIHIVAWMKGDFAAGRQLADESLDIYRRLDDRAGIADALGHAGMMRWAYGEYEAAEACHQQSLDLARDMGNHFLAAHALGGLAQDAFARLEWDLALQQAEESLEMMQELGHAAEANVARSIFCVIYVHAGEYGRAAEIIDAHPTLLWWPAAMPALVGVGRHEEVMAMLSAAAEEIAEQKPRYYTVDCLIAWAMLLTGDCPLERNGSPLLQADRVKMAREILTLVCDYDPDRSRASSRTRAAELLAEIKLDADAETDRALPTPVTQRTAQEIAQALLAIRVGTTPNMA